MAMAETSPRLGCTCLHKKTLRLRSLGSRRLCRTAFVAAHFLLLFTFYLLSSTYPYRFFFSSRRLQQVFSVDPAREIQSHGLRENNTRNQLSCHLANTSIHMLTNPPNDLPRVLRDYGAWHKQQRACLVDSRCKQKPRLLVFRCPKAAFCLGLGDRMRGVLFSLFYAIITKRVYFIAWPEEPFPLEIALAPASIDWTLPENYSLDERWPYLELLYCRIRPSCNWRQPEVIKSANINMTGAGINFYDDDLEARFSHYNVISVSMSLARRYFKKGHYLKNIFFGLSDTEEDLQTMEKAVYRTLFKPSNQVLRKMNSVSFGPGEPYFSVQIRTGSDVNETDEERFKYINSHLERTVENIIECLEIASVKNGIRKIFLAADSKLAKDIFLAKAQHRGFELKVFPKEIIHFLKVKFRKEALASDLCDSFLTVFADLYMLSRGRVLVSTGSHFANFAHALSGNQRSVHILYRPELGGTPREICGPPHDVE